MNCKFGPTLQFMSNDKIRRSNLSKTISLCEDPSFEKKFFLLFWHLSGKSNVIYATEVGL